MLLQQESSFNIAQQFLKAISNVNNISWSLEDTAFMDQ